jgi:hypothetical protein
VINWTWFAEIRSLARQRSILPGSARTLAGLMTFALTVPTHRMGLVLRVAVPDIRILT